MPLRLAILLTFAAGPVLATGFQFVEIPATADVPPIEAAVWYPSDGAPPDAPNTPFGQAVAMHAPVARGDLPLAVVSHGDGGWFGGHADLARALAEAGMIAAEVLLVARKSEDDLHRWVYLDIGKFSGLAETMDEAIRYQFVTPHDGEATGPCILAGPSCDSADVLYEKRPVALPLALASGDRILIRNCGAYTSSYASVGFNGFPPLDVVVI